VEKWYPPNDDIRICLFDIQRSWSKNAFWVVNNTKWRKWCKFVSLLFNNTFALPVLTLSTKCPNRVFFIDWSIYRLFLLNRFWKLEPLQMMIIVHVSSTCSVVELKTRFETWITRNVVNGVNLFLFSYLITLTIYLCSQCPPIVQFKYFKFDCSIYIQFVLNSGWKPDSHQMMIFVYVCWTCSVVEVTRFQTWNEVNGVYTFHISYLLTILVLDIKLTCAPHGHQI
jgi:hypothetical protein